MRQLRTRITKLRRRLAQLPVSTPGWSKAAGFVHEAEVALKHAELAMDRAEGPLPWTTGLRAMRETYPMYSNPMTCRRARRSASPRTSRRRGGFFRFSSPWTSKPSLVSGHRDDLADLAVRLAFMNALDIFVPEEGRAVVDHSTRWGSLLRRRRPWGNSLRSSSMARSSAHP
jgi:hypothetical protein